MIIEILAILFSLFVIREIVKKIQEKKITLNVGLFWIFLFLGVVMLLVNTKNMGKISNMFGVERGIDIFIYLGIMFMYYLVFRIFVKLDNLDKEIKELNKYFNH